MTSLGRTATGPRKHPKGRLGSRRLEGGFALIVTISLLVLLALVAVGLLSLSTVTVRTVGQSAAQEEARSNAELALLLAIADLQRAAGPDQRITATADIAAAANGQALEAGEDPANALALDGSEKGLSSVQPGTRYWTGVFVNRDDPELIYKKTPAARIERWLVSGLDDPDAAALSITPASEACSVSAAGTVSDPTQAAVLVGPGTVGTGPASQDRYVAAPMVTVDSGANSGFRGAFAYWIGDEGVKARINMERSSEDPEDYNSLVAQRRGWETVEGFAEYPPSTGDADHELPGLVTLPTAEVLIPSLRIGDPTPRQSVFHSATTESSGVLTDTLNGGTRVDLTAAFSNGLPTEKPPGSYDNYPVAGGRVIAREAYPHLQHLKWDHLAEFYKRREELSGDTLKVSERTGPDTPAIAPLITDFRILMGVRLKSTGENGQNTGRYNAYPCGKIAVAIANPYSVPLEWERDLEFEIINQTPNGNRPSRIWQINSTCVFIPKNGGFIDGRMQPSAEPAVFNQAVFRVKPGRLEPGEARAYTQAGKVVRPYANATRRQDVDMAPFEDSSPFDFNNCVEVETDTEITLPKTMDVRESWQTTLVMLEMRLGGSGRSYNWLRRLQGFELDNGYFAPNQRRFDSGNTRNLSGPVPLMLYSFQISQPGMDYLDLMPRGYEMGQRASTLRTFTDFNLQATNIHKNIASYNPPPYFMESNDSEGQLGPIRSPGGATGTGFTRNLAIAPLHWGRSASEGSNQAVLFSIPRQFSSLAQLQHADLTNDAVTVSVGHQPGNAFGNSYATPFVKRDLTEQERTDYIIMGSPNRSGAFQTKRSYYDVSHILNNCLWDRYFFSTIPSGTTTPENPTLVTALGAGGTDLHDPAEAAGGLMVSGAFNINSTDKNAWKAFLASTKHLEHQAESGDIPEATFPRSLEQPEEHALPPSGEDNDSFAGYRRLTDEELDDLATEIVRQVRLRGPFVSLSHFVNRSLANLTEERELTRSGPLQNALDESGVNISRDGTRNGFDRIVATEDRVTLAKKQGAPRADLDGGDLGGRPPDADRNHPDWAMTSRDNNFGAVASIVADQEMLSDAGDRGSRSMSPEQGYRSTGIPGWVTQADVLQVIGPAISARSDTFRIRTCGQARDAAGNVIATAYCEAIVQRQPSFVDSANRPHERADALSDTNQTYGRKFEVVSFRWLSPNEI